MSGISPDARAILAAIDNLTTQVVRALGGQTTPVVGQAPRTDDRAVHERNAAALYRQGLNTESALNAVFATFYPDGAPAAVDIDRLTAERDVIAVDLETVDRWCSMVTPTVERPWWQTAAELRAELEQAQAAIERARARHLPIKGDGGPYCGTCSQEERQAPPTGWWVPYPCPTVRALDGTTQPTTET